MMSFKYPSQPRTAILCCCLANAAVTMLPMYSIRQMQRSFGAVSASIVCAPARVRPSSMRRSRSGTTWCGGVDHAELSKSLFAESRCVAVKPWKGDINIGYRAYSEVLRIFPTMKEAITSLGVRHDNIYAWHKGVCPSAKYLARLHKAGADVIWILTGERNKVGR